MKGSSCLGIACTALGCRCTPLTRGPKPRRRPTPHVLTCSHGGARLEGHAGVAVRHGAEDAYSRGEDINTCTPAKSMGVAEKGDADRASSKVMCAAPFPATCNAVCQRMWGPKQWAHQLPYAQRDRLLSIAATVTALGVAAGDTRQASRALLPECTERSKWPRLVP